jgi:hypothetical protein
MLTHFKYPRQVERFATLRGWLPACADTFFGSLAISPVLDGSDNPSQDYFRDLPSLSQWPEVISSNVLWHTGLLLSIPLSPVPPSAFAHEVFPFSNRRYAFAIEPFMLFFTAATVLSLKSPLLADMSYNIRPWPVPSSAVTDSAGLT